MDNGLTLSNIAEIDKFTKSANNNAIYNTNIAGIQKAIGKLKGVDQYEFDIRVNTDASVCGTLSPNLRNKIRNKMFEIITPSVIDILNTEILNEIEELKKLIGE
jgi:hypothetical protein